MYHVMFPQEIIDLNKEITYHPGLIVKVMAQTEAIKVSPFDGLILPNDPQMEFINKLAAIATYLGIVLDDVYTQKEVLALCTLCTVQLMKQRKEWRVGHTE